jgi:hypothetical protein
MSLQAITNTGADLLFSAKRRIIGPQRCRRAQLYCVGMNKTGTHSIAAMFSKTVRAAHEPQAVKLLEQGLWRPGRLEDKGVLEWLRARDRELALEVDSSSLNIDLLDFLLSEFPAARFVLTIRDCYSWANSLWNHMISWDGKVPLQWYPWLEARCRPHLFQHAAQEQILKENRLHTLDGYFSDWTRHNSEVLAKVPAQRLLVVKTNEIRERAFEIADFAGLPRRAILLHRTRTFQNPNKQDLIRKIDRDFLEAKVQKHCRPLMTRFFPEIKSLDDVRL